MYYNTRKDITLANQEQLGKQMLYKGSSFIAKGNFAAAFSYINDGYELVTCDCIKGEWFNETYAQRETIIKLKELETNEPEYNFCLAFAFLNIAFTNIYISEKKTDADRDLMLESLEQINRYLVRDHTYLGLYLKGRILVAISGSQDTKLREALACLNSAFEIKINLPTLYRASQVRELLGEDALFGLYKVCLTNPSSLCAWGYLHDAAVVKRKLVIPSIKIRGYFSHNKLLRLFNNAHFYYFRQELTSHFNAIGLRGTHVPKFVEGLICSVDNDNYIKDAYEYSSFPYRDNNHLLEIQDFIFIMTVHYELFNSPKHDPRNYTQPETKESSVKSEPSFSNDTWGGDTDNNPYYNDDLDMDQQDQEFWDNL